MQKFFNWILVIAACVGMFYGIGLIVPRNSMDKAKIKLSAEPRELYKLVADISTWPSWFPGVVSVSERPERDGHPIWLVTTHDHPSFELEVIGRDEDSLLQVSYSFEGKRCGLHIVFGWDGQGGRMYLTKTTDTPDPWVRASLFFWPRDEAAPRAVLDAVAEQLGEEQRSEDA